MKPETGVRVVFAAAALLSVVASVRGAEPPPVESPPTQPQEAAIAEAAPASTKPDSDQPADGKNDQASNPFGLPQGWSGAIELGLSGSDGNTENFNMRTAFDLARKIGLADTVLRLTYRRSTDGGDVNANRFVADIRHDQRLAEKSPWSLFMVATYEYDDFQDWRQRLSLNAGFGYAFVDNKDTRLVGRVGAGANKRWGGADESWTPNGLIGLSLQHKLSERTSLYVGADYLPDISTSGEFRVNSRGGVKVLVDPQLNLNLHIGFEDRYDSNPGPGSQPNDIDYFVLLGWKF